MTDSSGKPNSGALPKKQEPLVESETSISNDLEVRKKFEVETIGKCVNGVLKQKTAATMLGVGIRQIQRKVHDYRVSGPEGLVIRPKRSKAYNAIADELKAEIIELYTTTYYDIGPLQTTEYLLERHGIKISKESLRQILMGAGLWKGKKAQAVHRRSRERRTCFGEMLQIDSSLHAWLGDKVPPFWLVNCIDDATGRINGLFFETDSTETNMECLKSWCELYGIPGSLYSDQACHFVYNPPKDKDKDYDGPTETQIQRALRELSITQILARSPQAKGRVERCFSTLQDRLVVGLRVNNIKTMEEASEFLRDKFIPRFNERFSVQAKSEVNAHRPKDSYDLDAIFSIQVQRKVNNDNTFRFDGKKYQIDLKSTDPDLKKLWVVIEKRLNGRMAVKRGKVYYKFHLKN